VAHVFLLPYLFVNRRLSFLSFVCCFASMASWGARRIPPVPHRYSPGSVSLRFFPPPSYFEYQYPVAGDIEFVPILSESNILFMYLEASRLAYFPLRSLTFAFYAPPYFLFLSLLLLEPYSVVPHFLPFPSSETTGFFFLPITYYGSESSFPLPVFPLRSPPYSSDSFSLFCFFFP